MYLRQAMVRIIKAEAIKVRLKDIVVAPVKYKLKGI
jgi:hypothetical protein